MIYIVSSKFTAVTTMIAVLTIQSSVTEGRRIQQSTSVLGSEEAQLAVEPLNKVQAFDAGVGKMSRRELAVGAVAAAAATATAAVQPAAAESTLVTRQAAYTRYVPRVERGRDFWAGGLKKLVATSDWATLEKELEPLGKKDKGGLIPKTFKAMELWASSFSGKSISEKTLEMNEQIKELKVAAEGLNSAVTGEEDTKGLFGLGGKKKMDAGTRQRIAIAAYKKGVTAFNKYIEIGNEGIGINFTPLDTI
jgi:hypothetical protein